MNLLMRINIFPFLLSLFENFQSICIPYFEDKIAKTTLHPIFNRNIIITKSEKNEKLGFADSDWLNNKLKQFAIYSKVSLI